MNFLSQGVDTQFLRFRTPSERMDEGHGEFLRGCVCLPTECHSHSSFLLRLSTVPWSGSDLRHLSVHPNLLHLMVMDGRRRVKEAELMQGSLCFEVNLLTRTFVLTKVHSEVRTPNLATGVLDAHNRLILGKRAKGPHGLLVTITKPKHRKGGRDDKGRSVESVLQDRLGQLRHFEKTQDVRWQDFVTRTPRNRYGVEEMKRCRVRFEFIDINDETNIFHSFVSEDIYDSKNYPFDLWPAESHVSVCERGGAFLTLISKHKLPSDIEMRPVVLIVDENQTFVVADDHLEDFRSLRVVQLHERLVMKTRMLQQNASVMRSLRIYLGQHPKRRLRLALQRVPDGKLSKTMVDLKILEHNQSLCSQLHLCAPHEDVQSPSPESNHTSITSLNTNSPQWDHILASALTSPDGLSPNLSVVNDHMMSNEALLNDIHCKQCPQWTSHDEHLNTPNDHLIPNDSDIDVHMDVPLDDVHLHELMADFHPNVALQPLQSPSVIPASAFSHLATSMDTEACDEFLRSTSAAEEGETAQTAVESVYVEDVLDFLGHVSNHDLDNLDHDSMSSTVAKSKIPERSDEHRGQVASGKSKCSHRILEKSEANFYNFSKRIHLLAIVTAIFVIGITQCLKLLEKTE